MLCGPPGTAPIEPRRSLLLPLTTPYHYALWVYALELLTQRNFLHLPPEAEPLPKERHDD